MIQAVHTADVVISKTAPPNQRVVTLVSHRTEHHSAEDGAIADHQLVAYDHFNRRLIAAFPG
jgi:hypothetical protein